MGAWICLDVHGQLIRACSQPIADIMATTLGASMVTIGFVEGFAEAAAAITKVFSGVISDYFRKRKFLAVVVDTDWRP